MFKRYIRAEVRKQVDAEMKIINQRLESELAPVKVEILKLTAQGRSLQEALADLGITVANSDNKLTNQIARLENRLEAFLNGLKGLLV